MTQAYDFALEKIGLDVYAFTIWNDYVTFLKSVYVKKSSFFISHCRSSSKGSTWVLCRKSKDNSGAKSLSTRNYDTDD